MGTASAVVVGAVVVLLVARQLGTVLLVLFAGLTLATAVRPAVALMQRRGLGRRTAALLVFATLAAVAALLTGVLLPILLDQLGGLLENAPRYLSGLRSGLLASSSRSLREIARELPLHTTPGPLGGGAADLLQLAGRATGAGLAVVAAFLVGYGAVVDGDRVSRRLLLALPLDRRGEGTDLLRAAGLRMGGYVRGQLLVSGAVGLMALAGYSAIRLPYAFLLAVIYAVLEAVPVLGPMVAAGAAGLVALSLGAGHVLWVAAIAVCIQLVENYVLLPRIMKSTVGVSPIVTLLAVVAFGSLAGVTGAVLAIPMAAVLQLLMDRYLLDPERHIARGPLARDREAALSWELRQVAADVRKLGRLRAAPDGQAERVEDDLEAAAVELEHVLDDVRGAS